MISVQQKPENISTLISEQINLPFISLMEKVLICGANYRQGPHHPAHHFARTSNLRMEEIRRFIVFSGDN